jgi:hypothetical protein
MWLGGKCACKEKRLYGAGPLHQHAPQKDLPPEEQQWPLSARQYLAWVELDDTQHVSLAGMHALPQQAMPALQYPRLLQQE